MPSKLLPNQWAIKFERCFLCGTSSKEGRLRHASKGLCFYCHKKMECKKIFKGIVRPKKWYKNYWEKIKNDPDAKKRYQDHCRQWRKSSPVFKAYLKRRNKRLKFRIFINEWFNNRNKVWQKRHMGIVVNFEHNGKEYKIRTPFKDIIGREREYALFERELRKYLDKHP